MEMAFLVSSSLAISTKPKPRGLPVARSCMTFTEVTWPAWVNRSCRSFSVASKERFPTNNFVPILYFYFRHFYSAEDERSQGLGLKIVLLRRARWTVFRARRIAEKRSESY